VEICVKYASFVKKNEGKIIMLSLHQIYPENLLAPELSLRDRMFTSDLHRLWEINPEYFHEFNQCRSPSGRERSTLKETAITNFKMVGFDKLYIHSMNDESYSQLLHEELKTYFKLLDLAPANRTFSIALDGLSIDSCKKILSILPCATTAIGFENIQDKAIIAIIKDFISARSRQGYLVTVFFGSDIPKVIVENFDDHNLICGMSNLDKFQPLLPVPLSIPPTFSNVTDSGVLSAPPKSVSNLLSAPPPGNLSSFFFKNKRKAALSTVYEEDEGRVHSRQKTDAEVSKSIEKLSLNQNYDLKFSTFNPVSTSSFLKPQVPPRDDFYFVANPFAL
jgi:hypothetical protein